jgi:hypothetical protein
MRKNIAMTLLAAIVASCIGNTEPSPGELVTKGDDKNKLYLLTIEGVNGDESKQHIEFSIDRVIVDSLKINTARINQICEEAVLYSDWGVNYKPTFKHDKFAILAYDPEKKCIVAHMSGTAENAYGTADNINTSIPFSLKGAMKQDKDGLPEIITF